MALGPLFDLIDIDGSGGITQAEMQAALRTTNDRLLDVFNALDGNGDGVISKLELLAKEATIKEVKTNTGNTKASVDSVGAGVNDEGSVAKWAKVTAKGVVPYVAPMLLRLTEHSKMLAALKDVRKKGIKPASGTGLTNVGSKKYGISFLTDIGGVTFSAEDLPIAKKAQGGIVGRYAPGGIVGNGMWNVDSVRARYAGGGDVMLAGGEGVINAAATSMIGPSTIDLINRTGRIPGTDNGPHFKMLATSFRTDSDTQNRVLVAGFRAVVENLGDRLERLEAAVTRQGEGNRRAIERKPVAKPATKRG